MILIETSVEASKRITIYLALRARASLFFLYCFIFLECLFLLYLKTSTQCFFYSEWFCTQIFTLIPQSLFFTGNEKTNWLEDLDHLLTHNRIVKNFFKLVF